jgi:hypothetical protein
MAPPALMARTGLLKRRTSCSTSMPPCVQEQLSRQPGRPPAEVFTMGWAWAGFDAVYTIARDLPMFVFANDRASMKTIFERLRY